MVGTPKSKHLNTLRTSHLRANDSALNHFKLCEGTQLRTTPILDLSWREQLPMDGNGIGESDIENITKIKLQQFFERCEISFKTFVRS